MTQIDISNIVTVNVSESPVGLAEYNVGNIAIFTEETPVIALTDDYAVYKDTGAVATQWGTSSETYKQAVAVFSQQPNILNAGASLIVIPLESAESVNTAITRTKDIVYYCGILATQSLDSEITDLSATVQSLNKILFYSSNDPDELDSGGKFYAIHSAKKTHTRCLLYTVGVQEARIMAAAYAGGALSTNFNASNSTSTRQLKDLIGIDGDDSITQTILGKCQDVGVDCYPVIAGIPKLLTSGANEFFDNVFNLIWFVTTLEVRIFNALSQTSTKIPQTEAGMMAIKDACQKLCDQAVNNRFIGAGTWTSPDIFGIQEDFLRNIIERGYYIYSQPIASQSREQRESRIAPITQIAIKYQGAIHGAIINITNNK